VDKQSTNGSVTEWLLQIRHGDEVATNNLVSRYFARLARYADKKRRSTRTTDDGEDIALEVLDAVLRRIKQEEYPDLNDRERLWLLLMVSVQNRVISRHRKHCRRLNLGIEIQTVTDLMATICVDLDEFLDDPDIETESDEILEFWERSIRSFKSEETQMVAKLKLTGLSNRQIAERLGMSPRSVDRKVQMILDRWAAGCEELP
jgi:DNA-directed RNA polymerase specialized sigma24 family protein